LGAMRGGGRPGQPLGDRRILEHLERVAIHSGSVPAGDKCPADAGLKLGARYLRRPWLRARPGSAPPRSMATILSAVNRDVPIAIRRSTIAAVLSFSASSRPSSSLPKRWSESISKWFTRHPLLPVRNGSAGHLTRSSLVCGTLPADRRCHRRADNE